MTGAVTAALLPRGSRLVPKHFPFPWFQSILRSGDCNAAPIANVFSSSDGLYQDLQSDATTPAFSWITPDNCSDAHDAVCHGNNLSGGWANAATAKAPVNYTGGLYAADLFLEHVIPEIEASPAFKDGGLIDITFDEAFPPFTYSGNSFANSTIVAPDAKTSVADDRAGETLWGRSVHYEPTGRDTPLAKSVSGQELYPGPGSTPTLTGPPAAWPRRSRRGPQAPASWAAAATHPARGPTRRRPPRSGSTTITDNVIVATDAGRTVTGTGIPAGAYVGHVTDTPATATAPAQRGGTVDTGSFIDASGHPIATTGPVSGIILAAGTAATDPLYDYGDATNGGGDTGSVLISPYIAPGSVSTCYYNHYSGLRTMEDLFSVGHAAPALDGNGHLGYAAQPGLAPFGTHVFTNPRGHTESGGRGPWAIPLAGLAAVGMVPAVVRRRRRRHQKAPTT